MSDWTTSLAKAIEDNPNFNVFCDQVWKYIKMPALGNKKKMDDLFREIEETQKEAMKKLSEENLNSTDETSPRDLLEAMLTALFLMCLLYEQGKMYTDILARFYMQCRYFCLAYAETLEERKNDRQKPEDECVMFSCVFANGDTDLEYSSDLRPNDYDPISYLSSNLVTRVMEKCSKEIQDKDLEQAEGDSAALTIGYCVTCIAYLNSIVKGKGMRNMCSAYILYNDTIDEEKKRIYWGKE